MKQDYVKFYPVVLDGDSLKIVEKDPEQDFYYRLEKVLKFYKEDYQLNEKSEVMVPSRRWEDTDLMWNYTSKANDSIWLKEHLLQEIE